MIKNKQDIQKSELIDQLSNDDETRLVSTNYETRFFFMIYDLRSIHWR